MQQRSKFYLASFLKNQTYFVPILIIFFQDIGLSYSEIFFVLTAGSVFSFIIEIPTGIFADLYGKRISIILSRLTIVVAFLCFGFSNSFITLLLANVLYELGKSFRSGTETAYIFDYLKLHPKEGAYTRIKAMQKFYARVSEAIAAAAGGFLASQFGFNIVFFLAAVPATLNFLQTLTWSKVPEGNGEKGIVASWRFLKKAMGALRTIPNLSSIIANIALLTTVFVGAETFIQPYMQNVGLSLENFGFIYSGFLICIAFIARYSTNLQKKFGGERMMNLFIWATFFPLLIVGLGFESLLGVGLLFLVLMIKNLHSPIANDVFHERVSSSNRATMGSLLALSGTFAQVIFLPVFGFVADGYSIYASILVLAAMTLVVGLFFRIPVR